MTGSSQRSCVIQERDRHLLRELSVMRVIDREQAKVVAGFGSTTRANARLLALTRAGLLKRFFLGTVASGRKALYALSLKGAALVQVPRRGPRRRDDQVLAVDFFANHQLFINLIHCTLKYKPIPDARFVRWLSFYEPIEPGIRLIPDGYVEVSDQDKIVAAFLEVDLGNEGLLVWKTKIQNYLRYAVSGSFERKFHLPRFRVLVVTNSERRMHSIRAVAAATSEKIFWFSTFDSINRDGFWSPAWLRPKGEQQQSLL